MASAPSCVTVPQHPVQCSISTSSICKCALPRVRPSSLSYGAKNIGGVRIGPETETSSSHHIRSLQRPALRRAASPVSSPPETTDETSLQTVMVEQEGVSVEGVAKVDQEQSSRPSWGRVGTLVAGDIFAILIFASVGRWAHGMSAFDWDVVMIADPFVAGWLLGSYFLGGYGPEGQGLMGLRAAALAAGKAWAVGIPLGLLVRGFTLGHAPPQAFMLISLLATFVLLLGWRVTFTAVFPVDDASMKKRSGDRKGNVFELFELLTSLVRRW